MEWWALNTLHPRGPLNIFFICSNVDRVVRGEWGITVQFNNSESAFAKGTLLRYSATEWQAHTPGDVFDDVTSSWIWRSFLVKRSHYCSRWMSLWACYYMVWEEEILEREKKKDKTNTESAAFSSSNQSSVMGNAGLGVCARLQNCPAFASCGNFVI